MTPDAAQPSACGTCGSPLNRYVDLTTGEARFTHPLSSATGQLDHQPDPVPAAQVDTRYVCDFCSDEKIVYTYRVGPVGVVVLAADEGVLHRYGGNWAACIECAQLIDARDLDGLHARTMRLGPPLDQRAEARVRAMQLAVVNSIMPGRALAAIGRWKPTPLPASTLPKVRDRLVRLVRGEDELPYDLNRPGTRNQLATGLDAAQLYWIDDDFTDLARRAARSLPATTVVAADAPAPHGMLAWAVPMGDRADIVAASWTSSTDGARVVCYRSVGAGLSGSTLQRLGEQVGWLIPNHTAQLRPGDLVEAESPASNIVATWLLIGQKLAETESVTVDKTIRKAYKRSGRPAPEVRLVRIRGAVPAGGRQSDGQARGEPGREREYRWWVRGHWRNQPYGPGRAERRLIYIDPQVRGPEGKPIKASTTVRVLGAGREHGGEKQDRPPNDR
jgi:hypothetical protein